MTRLRRHTWLLRLAADSMYLLFMALGAAVLGLQALAYAQAACDGAVQLWLVVIACTFGAFTLLAAALHRSEAAKLYLATRPYRTGAALCPPTTSPASADHARPTGPAPCSDSSS